MYVRVVLNGARGTIKYGVNRLLFQSLRTRHLRYTKFKFDKQEIISRSSMIGISR